MTNGFFITGTDTGVGKTLVSVALIKALQANNLTVAGMKPVASGCHIVDEKLVNPDAVALQQASSVKYPYSTLNPFAYEPTIAPHIAAQLSDIFIKLSTIEDCYRKIATHVDMVVVEGAGGWLVPLNDTQTMADIPRVLDLPVILVVGLRLGCLNHALLTVASIQHQGVQLAGWIANVIDKDMQAIEQNIHYLQQHIHAPLLASIPYLCEDISPQILQYFDKSMLNVVVTDFSTSLADK